MRSFGCRAAPLRVTWYIRKWEDALILIIKLIIIICVLVGKFLPSCRLPHRSILPDPFLSWTQLWNLRHYPQRIQISQTWPLETSAFSSTKDDQWREKIRTFFLNDSYADSYAHFGDLFFLLRLQRLLFLKIMSEYRHSFYRYPRRDVERFYTNWILSVCHREQRPSVRRKNSVRCWMRYRNLKHVCCEGWSETCCWS